MSDHLENKIKDQLAELDSIEKLDIDLMWDDFRRRRTPQNPAKKAFLINARWYAIAASITLLVSFFIFIQSDKNPNKYLIVSNLDEVDEDLAHYQNSLVLSMDAYASTLKSMNVKLEDFPDIEESLDQVERLAISYQNDLKKYGPDPKIIKAILKCSKQKVELYEILLYQLEIKNYHEKKSEKFKI